MNELWTIVDFVLMIAQWVIVIQAVLSWLIAFNVINTHNDAVRGIWQALDLSPMVVLLGIILLRRLVQMQVTASAYVS